MNKEIRKPLIAGNWKMNLVPDAATALMGELLPLVDGADCEVAVCVPATDLCVVREFCENSNILLGAQNCHWAESGAFTGEISGPMLKAAGVDVVIVGHSERRQYFGDTDATVNSRLKAVLKSGMHCILCVGETLEQRENGATNLVVAEQLTAGLVDVTPAEMDRVIIAYEPIWAIGTGKTATAEQAQDVCGFIRAVLAGFFDFMISDRIRILYGGSMNGANAEELLDQPDIDGGLIGGASLKAEEFAKIVRAASR